MKTDDKQLIDTVLYNGLVALARDWTAFMLMRREDR